ncbi:hypothetical protein HGB13_00710 [bacterium]|nr:hypothetical protein [bacterium]
MNKINKNGLTILEVLISIAVVSVVIGAVVILIVNISNYGSSAEVRSTAVNFAQEAVDIVKNVRDNDYCRFFSATYPNNQYYRINPDPSGAPPANGVYTLVSGVPSTYWQPKYSASSLERLTTGDLGWKAVPDVPEGLARRIYISAVPNDPAPIAAFLPFEARRITVEVKWKVKGVKYSPPEYPVATPYDSYRIITDIYKWKY